MEKDMKEPGSGSRLYSAAYSKALQVDQATGAIQTEEHPAAAPKPKPKAKGKPTPKPKPKPKPDAEKKDKKKTKAGIAGLDGEGDAKQEDAMDGDEDGGQEEGEAEDDDQGGDDVWDPLAE